MKTIRRLALGAAALLATTTFAQQARTVRPGPNDIPTVKTKVRYTTLIELPPGEKLKLAITGDQEFWKIEGLADNKCSVKPAKEGTATNLMLFTESDHVYSFMLTEISMMKAEPDLKVVVEPNDGSAVVNLAPKLVTKDEAEAGNKMALDLARQAKSEADHFKAQYPTRLRFDYTFDQGKEGLRIKSIYHDDRTTYIQVETNELPALYELKEGKPALVTFRPVRDAGASGDPTLYVVPKVLDRGYLAIGKTKLSFARK